MESLPREIWREIIVLCDELSLMRMQQVCRFFRDEIQKLPVKHDINHCCKNRLYVQINKILQDQSWKQIILREHVIRSRDPAIVKRILIELSGKHWYKNANTDDYYHDACVVGCLDIVKLLQRGADDVNCTTGLDFACFFENIDVVEYIVSEVEQSDMCKHISWGVVIRDAKDPQIIRIITECINKYSPEAWGSILRRSCVDGNTAQLIYLIDHCANKKCIREEFRYQCEYGDITMAEILVDRINVKDELERAISHGYTRTEDYLRQYIDMQNMFA